VGATGLVGSVLLKLFEERQFSFRNLYLLASERSLGESIRVAAQNYSVELIDTFDFSKTQLCFFCVGNDISEKFVPLAVAAGNMSGAVTTSGMAFKIHGRVGDSPIIGAGLFVDNEVGAATSSGLGEEVMRICGTHVVVEYMRHGLSPERACKKAIERIINRDAERAKTLQVGFLALNKKGQYGAYAVQKGFVFAVKSDGEEKIIPAKYFYDFGVS